MKMLNLVFGICVILTLAGCSNDYSARLPDGYTVTQMTQDTFRVIYRGKSSTLNEVEVQDFAYYRAVKVTLERGFTCFVLLDDSFQQVTAQPTNSFMQYYQPEDTLQIKCFQAKPDSFYSFDAAFMEHSIKQKYSIK